MDNPSFDLVIIGAGPGGCEAAKVAADRGLKTAIISNTKIGGRAAFGSLLPSKMWLNTADLYRNISNASTHAIHVDAFRFDIQALKENIVKKSAEYSTQITENLESLKITIFQGNGIITGKNTVEVRENGNILHTLQTKYILIATGSTPRFTPEIKPNKDRILAPKLAPLLPEIPRSILIVGGGVTGMEYAYVFAQLGAQVTVLHNKRHILSYMDVEVADYLEDYYKERYDMVFHKGLKVRAITQEGKQVKATLESGESFVADYGFIGIGRKPDDGFYDKEAIDFVWNDDSSLKVNSHGHTGVAGIYAIGDVTGIPMMANKAILQAKIAVKSMVKKVDYPERYHFISSVYCYPPVAQIASTKRDGQCDIIIKPYKCLLRAQMNGETVGMLKLKVDPDTDLIKGVSGVGPGIYEILAPVQIAMEQHIPYDELINTHFANPSFSELISMEIIRIKE